MCKHEFKYQAVDSGKISFGSVTSSKDFCPDDVKVLNKFKKAKSWKTKKNGFSLFNEKGK